MGNGFLDKYAEWDNRNQEFAESKAASDNNAGFAQAPAASAPTAPAGDGFMNIPDNADDSGLPFNF